MGDDPVFPGLIGEGLPLRRPVLALQAVQIDSRTVRCGDLLIRCDRPVTALYGALAALHDETVAVQLRDAQGVAIAFIADIRAALQ